MQLAEILSLVGDLSPDQRGALASAALAGTKHLVWIPNPGPQTLAAQSDADELFYGGQAGGGKSDLAVGLSLTQHRRSLILRRYKTDAAALAERAKEILGSEKYEFRQQPTTTLTYGDRVTDYGGCQEESDKQRYKGNPHDLIAFDEVSDFLESQYKFIIAWNRSAVAGQRCRVLCTGNPPTTAEGLWVIRHWAAWLDPNHPRPAREGDLRWYTTGADGREIEVDGPGPHLVDGEKVVARSRTFIRARLSDNPDLAATNYDAVLAALPPELREAYRSGRFDLGLKDDPWQVIPTEWIRAAQARWTERPPPGVPQTSIGCDVAQGGDDSTVLAPLHDWWFAPLVKVPGTLTPTGASVAGLVLQHRRDDSRIGVDMGGGYGGATYEHLKDNGIDVVGYKGAEATPRRTADRMLGFTNRRSEAYWRLREALDPGQPGGSPLALPPGAELLSDLTAPKYEVGPRGITITPKEKLVALLGRSPDEGDAVVIAWYVRLRNTYNVVKIVDEARPDNRPARMSRNRTPQVDFGRRRK